MITFCLAFLRRVAPVFFLSASIVAFAANQRVFPVLQYEPYAVPAPLAMAEGDLNGDGSVDTLYAAAATTVGSSTLTAALRSANTSSGPTLAASVTLPGCTVNSVLLADLNNDKKLDAVVTCKENSVAVLPGNGDGTFGALTSYPVTAAVKGVAADINGDGFADLLFATNTTDKSSAFAVMLNSASTASPVFAAPRIYGGFAGVVSLIVGDNNGDGKPDVLAVVNPDIIIVQSGGNISNPSTGGDFTNKGDGTFGEIPGTTSAKFAIADFDGDGIMDAASYFLNGLTTNVGIYLRKSASTKLINVQGGVVSLQPIDVNVDGMMDLILTGSTTTILLGDGKGNLTVGKAYATPGSFYTTRKGSAGIDLVFSTPRGFYALHNDGHGAFDGIPSLYLSASATVEDLNHDGISDFAGSLIAPRNFDTAIGRGDGSFLIYPFEFLIPPEFPSSPVLADFNGRWYP